MLDKLDFSTLHLRTTIESDDESADHDHLVGLAGLGQAHEERAQHAEHIVKQQALLPIHSFLSMYELVFLRDCVLVF